MPKKKIDPEDPKYYHKPIQPVDFITANGLNYLEGNIIKYIVRWKEKNGTEDLKKARVYLDFLINCAYTGRPRVSPNEQKELDRLTANIDKNEDENP